MNAKSWFNIDTNTDELLEYMNGITLYIGKDLGFLEITPAYNLSSLMAPIKYTERFLFIKYLAKYSNLLHAAPA